MMRVVDTSVAVKWVVPETGFGMEAETGLALLLLQRGLMAPDFMLAEFANAMWKKVRRSEISSEQAHESVGILPELLTFLPGRAFVARALEMSLELQHPLYDCIFWRWLRRTVSSWLRPTRDSSRRARERPTDRL